MDCGPTCLRIISKHYGRHFTAYHIGGLCQTNKEGSSLKGIADAAEAIGFRSMAAKITFDQLRKEATLPAIVHWKQSHFVVVYRVSKTKVCLSDPAFGLLMYSHADFLRYTQKSYASEAPSLVILLLEPTDRFYGFENMPKQEFEGFGIILDYFRRYKTLLVQLIFGLLGISLIQLVIPFTTQSIVDIGIVNKDIHFVSLILFAQLLLFLGRTSIDLVRGWTMLHLSTRISISLVSDFFIKLMKLPIGYFDTRLTGDIVQRISDHSRIESFLTSSSLTTLFSVTNLLIFGIVLSWYNLKIFGIFLIGTCLYLAWVLLFLKKRRELDFKRFSAYSAIQSVVFELINGMQEIKLHNAERQKRWKWERRQAGLFKISTQSLTIEQLQSTGSALINETKNIGITALAATMVINGDLTLGMLLAISYIAGQLNAPVQQIVNFIHSFQSAKIAFERIGEIRNIPDEESLQEFHIKSIPKYDRIELNRLTFQYKGSSHPVLKDISLTIPSNQTTAIVGASGSGKTTLLKLLLRFYKVTSGEIRIGNYLLDHISYEQWRDHCGVVMQEGFIFNDTIARNIALDEDSFDMDRLVKAVQIANIEDFIANLPKSYDTKIGNEGVGISTGQKQRILIARAVYKNPKVILFDEATSALDSTTEKIVMSNLTSFFKERTTIIIAHRLSTVQNADQIIVLGNGKVLEVGTRHSLARNEGPFYHLVKNQLQLDNPL